jgi:hypothetical protein
VGRQARRFCFWSAGSGVGDFIYLYDRLDDRVDTMRMHPQGNLGG